MGWYMPWTVTHTSFGRWDARLDYYSGTYPEVPNIEVFRVLAVDRESAIKKARGVRTRTIRAAAQKDKP